MLFRGRSMSVSMSCSVGRDPVRTTGDRTRTRRRRGGRQGRRGRGGPPNVRAMAACVRERAVPTNRRRSQVSSGTSAPLCSEWRREYNARLDAKRSASQAAVQARKDAAAKAISDYLESKETQREAKLNAGRCVPAPCPVHICAARQNLLLCVHDRGRGRGTDSARPCRCPWHRASPVSTREQELVARLDEVASGNTWDRVLSLVRRRRLRSVQGKVLSLTRALPPSACSD